jgi:hypothetical protein
VTVDVQPPGPLFERPIEEGPFSGSHFSPTKLETLIGGLIWIHQGRENPISIARLREISGVGDRMIKAVVTDLIVTHRMRIGSRREEPAGYFMIRDAEDIEAGTRAYKNQFLSEALRLRVLDPKGMQDLFGQLHLEDAA